MSQFTARTILSMILLSWITVAFVAIGWDFFIVLGGFIVFVLILLGIAELLDKAGL